MLYKTMLAFSVGFCSLVTLCLAQTDQIQTKQEDKSTMSETAVKPKVTFQTNKGTITVELYNDKAPKTVENFLQYVKDGHYENTIFHRVIPGFVVQGGGFTVDFKQKPTRAPIAIESNNGLSNSRGTLSMARTSDPNSATAQFYINLTDNKNLDYSGSTPSGYGYTVFGKVVEGMDVVDQIAKAKTVTSGMHRDVPLDPIEIQKVTVTQ